MRGLAPLVVVILSLSNAAAAESDRFPFEALVTVEQAELRCGPGVKYYVTQQLPAGSRVEIYRRDPGGWFAIRPPAGSFSWVRADQLASTSDPGVGQVRGDHVVAWVGALTADVQHQWQVQLEAQEVVEIHDRRRMTIVDADEEVEYYRIGPPAGEFRWIHQDSIEPIATEPIVAESKRPESVQLAEFQIIVDRQSTPATATPATATPATATPAKTTPPTETRTGTPTIPPARSPDGFVPRSPSRQRDSADIRVASRAPRQDSRAAPARATSKDSEFETRLKDLDLQLALVVSRKPETWEFSSLRNELSLLEQRATTTLHRARTKVVIDKLQKFESLHTRYAGLDMADTATTEPANPGESQVELGLSNSTGLDPRFDGKGWLLPVHSSKRGSPPFALLDSDGKILQFISPAPGLNLNRYVRQEVGVFGQRGQAGVLDKPHLTAHRIVNLERHRR